MTAQNFGSKLQTASFKVTGWSVKCAGDSLLHHLTTLGCLISFIHYPQLNSSYVVMRFKGRKVDLLKLIGRVFPKARVEMADFSDLQEAEKELENPNVTAFISSRYFINEAEIFSKLNPFGGLRAMTFSFSNQHSNWYCKASFYERFSLEQLLRSRSKSLHTMQDGSLLKINKLKNPERSLALEPRQDKTPRLLAQARPCTQETVCLNSNTKCSRRSPNISSNCRFWQKPSSQKVLVRRSRSETRISLQRLPPSGMFSNKSLFLENVLRIVKSRRNEARYIQGASNITRSRSLHASQKKEDFFAITFSSNEKRNRNISSNFEEHTFRENELLFLEIGQNRCSDNYNFTNQCSKGIPLEVLKGKEASYLSQADLSDGFTAVEEYIRLTPVTKYPRETIRSQNSGKGSSLILLTEYSSDAEHNLAERYGPNSNWPEFSNFDSLFDSSSVQVNVIQVIQPPRSGALESPHLKLPF